MAQGLALPVQMTLNFRATTSVTLNDIGDTQGNDPGVVEKWPTTPGDTPRTSNAQTRIYMPVTTPIDLSPTAFVHDRGVK